MMEDCLFLCFVQSSFRIQVKQYPEFGEPVMLLLDIGVECDETCKKPSPMIHSVL
jgi:hypothetical protein